MHKQIFPSVEGELPTINETFLEFWVRDPIRMNQPQELISLFRQIGRGQN